MNSFTIVLKDADFHQRSLLYRHAQFEECEMSLIRVDTYHIVQGGGFTLEIPDLINNRPQN